MSKYLDSFSPEATLGEVFHDLHERASEVVGEHTDSLPAGRRLIVPGTMLEFQALSREASAGNRRLGTNTVFISDVGAQIQGIPLTLIALETRARRLGEDSDFEASGVAAAGEQGWYPTYSVRRTPIGSIVIDQLIDTAGADKKSFGMLSAGSSSAHNEEELILLDPEHKRRLDIVTSVILRNIGVVELIKEGRSLREAFKAVNEKLDRAA